MRWLMLLGACVIACKPRAESLRQKAGETQVVAGRKIGDIGLVAPDGKVVGWAVNPGQSKETVTVRFFERADATSSIGEIKADQVGFADNHEGNHAFTWQVPKDLCDGANRELFVRAVVGGKEQNMGDRARSYTCFQPTPGGKEFFTTTVAPLLKACGECHQHTYEKAWGYLASPSPTVGGSATNNDFIRSPAADVRHGGGKMCADINTSPCKEIQEWWKKEFTKG